MTKISQVEKGLNLNIHRLSYLVDDITNQVLKSKNINLTNSQYIVLKSVYILKNPTQTQLSKFLFISKPAITRHIQNLSKKNYLIVNYKDKKTKYIVITKKGESIFEESKKYLQNELKNLIPQYDMISESVYRCIKGI